jgi:catechol 2,3-dioxygenase-like lactoylglutathione lyase family enzyme
MFQRISHIGIVVRDIDVALRIWRDQLGFKQFAEMSIDVEGVRSVFLSLSGRSGEMSIELMEPVDKSDMGNAVARRLAQRGEGFYHLAVVSDDVAAAGRDLPVIDRPPLPGAAQGRWLLHPRDANGIMIEAIEEWADGRP